MSTYTYVSRTIYTAHALMISFESTITYVHAHIYVTSTYRYMRAYVYAHCSPTTRSTQFKADTSRNFATGAVVEYVSSTSDCACTGHQHAQSSRRTDSCCRRRPSQFLAGCTFLRFHGNDAAGYALGIASKHQPQTETAQREPDGGYGRGTGRSGVPRGDLRLHRGAGGASRQTHNAHSSPAATRLHSSCLLLIWYSLNC